jgi:hypothetical protein
MNKHTITVFQELFRRVGDEYSVEKTADDFWFNQHEWTEEEQKDFIKWLTDYLMVHKEARHELMRFPIRNKKKCEATAQWFSFQYGWKTKK